MNQKEFYHSLSEDVKAKIKACKSEEEMMQVLAAEKIELDPEVLKDVSGGFEYLKCPYHTCSKHTSGC